jgi:hypothetical protein
MHVHVPLPACQRAAPRLAQLAAVRDLDGAAGLAAGAAVLLNLRSKESTCRQPRGATRPTQADQPCRPCPCCAHASTGRPCRPGRSLPLRAICVVQPLARAAAAVPLTSYTTGRVASVTLPNTVGVGGGAARHSAAESRRASCRTRHAAAYILCRAPKLLKTPRDGSAALTNVLAVQPGGGNGAQEELGALWQARDTCRSPHAVRHGIPPGAQPCELQGMATALLCHCS